MIKNGKNGVNPGTALSSTAFIFFLFSKLSSIKNFSCPDMSQALHFSNFQWPALHQNNLYLCVPVLPQIPDKQRDWERELPLFSCQITTQSRSGVAQRKIACLRATLLESKRAREFQLTWGENLAGESTRFRFNALWALKAVWPLYWWFLLGWIWSLITDPTQNTMNPKHRKST